MRVVSLTCSNTEIVVALGCADLLVGVDDHSDWPEEVVASLPRLGPDLEIDLDRVESLEPDLVLATLTVPGHETVVEGLERRGLPFIAPAPTSIPDVYRDVREIAGRLGVAERAADVIRRLAEATGIPDRPGEPLSTAELDRIRDQRETALPPGAPRVLVQWWPKPVIAPGRRSWTHDVIVAAGLRNVLGGEDVISRPLTDAEVRELAPDVIVLSWCGVEPSKYRPDVVLGNPEWADVPAVRDGRVFCVPEAFMGRPGPRLVEGVEALRALVD
jgi:iron complex transport system substrate-binding protein